MNQMPYPNPNQGNQNPYQGNQNPYQGNPNPYQGNPNPYQGNPNPYQGNLNPYQGNLNPYQGNPNPYQGYQNPYPMNQNSYPGSQGFHGGIEDPYAIKNRTAVLVMAFISLGCNLLGFIVSLFPFGMQSLFSDFYIFFKYDMPLFFSNFLMMSLSMAPLVLLVLYLLAFHKKPKSSTLMVIAFWICAFALLLRCVMYLIVGVSMSSLIADILFAILYAVFFSLTAVDAAKGLSRKVFLILAFSVGMLSQLYDFIGFVTNVKWYIDYNRYGSIITGLIGVVGGVLYYLALLLFGLKNRIRPLSGNAPAQGIGIQR